MGPFFKIKDIDGSGSKEATMNIMKTVMLMLLLRRKR